jgi:hypothetical protein
MDKKAAYKDFTQRLKLLIAKNPQLITVTLSNIFTMRLVGNKTHGDLAEIAIAEFVNQYMYDFKSIHVGKDLFRAKQSEEDIQIINEITKAEFSVSLKAYGDGPLQLSTDKQSLMFKKLQDTGTTIEDEQAIEKVMNDPVFDNFRNINVLPLIYDEKRLRCNILVFDYERAKKQVVRIIYTEEGRGRKHPVYRFFDSEGQYVCEVRYGGATANALQRGLWTNTKNASSYFDSLTGGWINYALNPVLVKCFSHALLATPKAHEAALAELQKDIEEQKRGSQLS